MKKSPTLRPLFQKGKPFRIYPLDSGRIGLADNVALERSVDKNLILVTANATGLRTPVESGGYHSILIIVRGLAIADSETFILALVEFVEAQGAPMDIMVNHVFEIGVDRPLRRYPLPDEAL